MAIPLAAIGAAGGALANFLGGIFGNSAQNQQRQQLLNLGMNGLNNFSQNQIQNPNQILMDLMGPVRSYANGLLPNGPGNINDQATENRFDQNNFLNSILPGLMQPGNLGAYYNSPLGDLARQYDPMVAYQNSLAQGVPGSPGYGSTLDAIQQILGGQNPALAGMMNKGNTLIDQEGTTGYNLGAQDNAGRAISAGGYNPQTQGLYNAGNGIFSTGGWSPQTQALFGASQGAAANGGISPQIAALLGQAGGIVGGGGFTPGTQNFSQMAQGIPNFAPGSGGGATQASMFGGPGGAALQQLFGGQSTANIPGFGSSFGGQQSPAAISPQQLQSAFTQGMSSGYTPQNMGVGDLGMQGMQQLLARDPQIDQLTAYGQQAFGGKLPGGAANDPYAAQLNSIIGQLGGLSVGGGGGASGASAGQMGPMDPTLAGILQQGSQYFKNNPLIPMSERMSMAVNDAASAASQQAEAAQRFARSRGGGGAIVNTGTQNQAMVDFADQALKARGDALSKAILDQQNLGLQQQMQGAQIGLGASNADTARQQVAAQRDIASANNATQASVANAQTQASLAAQGASLRSAALQAAAQAALGMRGQDYAQSQAGLGAMSQAQQLATQRGALYNQDVLGALQDATNRYQTGMGILPGLTSANASQMSAQAQMASALAQQMGAQGNYINQAGANQNQRMLGVLDASLQGSNMAGNQNNAYSQILAGLGLGGENAANNRLGTGMTGYLGGLGAGNSNLGLGITGMGNAGWIANNNLGLGFNAMGTAGGLANNALSTYGNIGSNASADALARLGLGSQFVNSGLNNIFQAGGLGNTTNNSIYGNIAGMGNLANNTLGQQASLYNNMFNLDASNRNAAINAYGTGYGNQNTLLNTLFSGYNQANNPLTSMFGSTMSTFPSANAGYASIMNSLLGQSPQQQNPWPQLNLGGGGATGLGGIFGGFGGGGTSGPTAIGGPINPAEMAGLPGYGGY